MTLSFSTKINGQPTYFVEKIWKSIKDHEITQELADASSHHNFDWDAYGSSEPKKHTIREDSKDRWKPGTKIHFVINNRTKNRFQFAPILECVSVQKFEVKYYIKNNANKVDVLVDGKEVDLNDLALNDGFYSLGDFLDYFQKDFTGKIIHWTNLKY